MTNITRVKTALRSSIVVIGMKSENPPRWILMSPGSLPSRSHGSLAEAKTRSPMTTMVAPRATSSFPSCSPSPLSTPPARSILTQAEPNSDLESLRAASLEITYRQSMKLAIHAGIWFAALAALAAGQTQAPTGFTVKRIPKVGDAIKYKMTADFVALAKGSLTATLLEEVKTIDKDGSYSLQQTQIDASGVYDNEKVDVPARTPITIKYKPDGHLSAIQGDLIDSNSYRVENLALVIDPGKPIEVGSTWMDDIPADKDQKTPAVHLEYKLLGTETVAGVDCLKIKGSGNEVGGVNPAKHAFTVWLSKTDGSRIELDSKWDNAPFPGISSPVSASIKIVMMPA